jgi:class 3 adenylate cyclase/tetratricopeptide (TPR) repeat protein
MRFCANCGAAVASPHPPAPLIGPAPVAEGGERRFLILLFCDMVGSTEISSRLDPEEVRDLMRAYQAAIATAIRDYGGHFARDIGDGALIYFGWPQAHENDAERAVRAGLAIVEQVERIDHELEAGLRVEVRVGIHAGFLVVERTGEIFGDTPNIAARVQTAARPGTVFITEAMMQLLGGRCLSEDAGKFALKGISEPLALHRVLGFRADEPSLRSRAALVDRVEEMARLIECWEAARQGRGQSVAIVAEAGIGKSRLVHGLRERIALPAGAWLEMAGSELHQRSPFFPVVQLVERQLGLRPATAAAERMARLRGALMKAGVQAGVPADAALAPLADLLGLPVAASYAVANASPERRREAILGALTAWILGQARAQPTVLAVEDHHWLDPSSSELIGRLASRLDGARLLVVLTERPAAVPRRASSVGMALTLGVVLTLGQLAEPDIRSIVAGIVDPAGVPAAVIDRLVARTGGNPLFANELAQLMVDRRGQANEHEIPTTLAGSLTARLDALGFDKEIAQIGAVLGAGFARATALELGQIDPDRLDDALNHLVRAGILALGAEDGTVSYSFAHALIRDTAYESLLRSRRRELHLRAAAILSRPDPDGRAARPEIAAHHWDRGGEPTRAAQAWQEAGLAASARGAFQEAEASYQNGLDSLARLPEAAERDVQELKLTNMLVRALQITRGYNSPEVTEAQGRVRLLKDRTGDVSEQFEATATEWILLSTQGKFVEGNLLADRVSELADRLGRPDALANAQMMQMTARYRVGDLLGAEQSFRRGRAFYQSEAFHKIAGCVAQTFGTAARNAWLLGLADTARERSQYALLALADRPFDLAFAQYMAAILAMLLRDPETALRLGTQSLESSDALKFPVFSAISRVVVGRAAAELGDTNRGLAMIEEGIGRMERTGSRNGLTLYLAWLAEAQALSGRWDEAEKAIDRALSANPEERFFEAECLRIRGEIRAAQGRRDAAIDDFVLSHQAARRMGARISEIRTWLAASRLSPGDARLPAAGEQARLYDEMGEGRDTADMKRAAALRAGMADR